MKKSIIAAAALVGVVTLGGCSFGSTDTIYSSGITSVGNGRVVVSLNKYTNVKGKSGNKTPIVYDCSKGNVCVELGK